MVRPQTRFTLIRHEVCAFFDRFVEECGGRDELGGILIGGRRGPHLEVVEVTQPAPGDRATRTSFRRSDPAHQQAANRAWHRAHRTLSYIGEWHSHPIAGIEPSSIDIATWRGVAAQQDTVCVFVLVTPGGWGAFEVAGRRNAKVERLSELERGAIGLVFG